MDLVSQQTNERKERLRDLAEHDRVLAEFQSWNTNAANLRHQISDINYITDTSQPVEQLDTREWIPSIRPASLDESKPNRSLTRTVRTLGLLKGSFLTAPSHYENLTNFNNAILNFSGAAESMIKDAGLTLEEYMRAKAIFDDIIEAAKEYQENYTREQKRKTAQGHVDALKFLMNIFEKGSPIHITTEALFESAKFQLDMI